MTKFVNFRNILKLLIVPVISFYVFHLIMNSTVGPIYPENVQPLLNDRPDMPGLQRPTGF